MSGFGCAGVGLLLVVMNSYVLPLKIFVAIGDLVFYGFDIDDSFRLCASVVDRVLKGANPATTPFEQPAHIALVLNLKSARALGLKFPPSVIARADEVIQ